MEVKEWHFVYQTVNLMNGKIYIGVHTSYVNPDKKFDGYWCSVDAYCLWKF